MAETSYTYDPGTGKMSAVTDVRSLQTWTYGYEGGSTVRQPMRWNHVSNGNMKLSRDFDALGRVDKVMLHRKKNGQNEGFDLLDRANYTYDAKGQRIGMKRTREDGADDPIWEYEYNDRGEVVAGRRGVGYQFTYEFDAIGNRKETTVNGRVSGYGVNENNQITTRTVPGVAELRGRVPSGGGGGKVGVVSVLRVDGADGGRKEQVLVSGGSGRFYGATPVDNSAGAVWVEREVISIKEQIPWNGSTLDVLGRETGGQFVAATPETLTYDEDGNLTRDGRWDYTWDAENRLVKVETRAALRGKLRAGLWSERVEMRYDYLSRRTSLKRTSVAQAPGGGAGAETVTSHRRMIWDGWRMVAELETATGGAEVAMRNTWGLDVSGTLEGAGCVGGLLGIHANVGANWSRHGGKPAAEAQAGGELPDLGTGPYASAMCAYDGNGNVLGLYVLGGKGTELARYEYGPFGESLRVTGLLGHSNPWRWSTKHTEELTGLVYYGYRWYDSEKGRWLGHEPLGEGESANLYAFLFNRVNGWIDYLGLSGLEISEIKGDNIPPVVDSENPPPFPIDPKPPFKPGVKYFTIRSDHGSSDCLKDDKGVKHFADEVAAAVKSKPEYKEGMAVFLVTACFCCAGEGKGGDFGADLAKALGADVIGTNALNTNHYTMENGKMKCQKIEISGEGLRHGGPGQWFTYPNPNSGGSPTPPPKPPKPPVPPPPGPRPPAPPR